MHRSKLLLLSSLCLFTFSSLSFSPLHAQDQAPPASQPGSGSNPAAKPVAKPAPKTPPANGQNTPNNGQNTPATAQNNPASSSKDDNPNSSTPGTARPKGRTVPPSASRPTGIYRALPVDPPTQLNTNLPYFGLPKAEQFIRRPALTPQRFGLDLFLPARERILRLRQPPQAQQPNSQEKNPEDQDSSQGRGGTSNEDLRSRSQSRSEERDQQGNGNPDNGLSPFGTGTVQPPGATGAPGSLLSPSSTAPAAGNAGGNSTGSLPPASVASASSGSVNSSNGDVAGLNTRTETLAGLPGTLPAAASTGSPAPTLDDASQLFMGTGRTQLLPNYALARGDRIILRYRSPALQEQSQTLAIDSLGRVALPGVGMIVGAGLTLQQFEAAAQLAMRRFYQGITVNAELTELHNIRVFVTGEAFQPGPQIVPAATTLFSLLYLVGGPSDAGSMRDIRLIRGRTTTRIDLYRYLINGDATQDRPLQDGDTILVSLVGRSVGVQGEVKRPAIYELLPGENLRDALAFAGHLTPIARADRVQVQTNIPNQGPTLRDVDLRDPKVVSSYQLHDGDVILVSPNRKDVLNIVSASGQVGLPGAYSFHAGMRVTDLLDLAQGIRGEVFLDRADLFRLNADLTTSVIPINLGKAIQGDPTANIALEQQDRLLVYSRAQVAWMSQRMVSVAGAVQRPGTYDRPNKDGGFRVGDLLLLAGGPLPNAFLQQALIERPSFSAEPPTYLKVDLTRAGHDDPSQNLELKDGDTLVVYAQDEAAYIPERVVRIMGTVQRPGTYERHQNMRISDLLFLSGGLRPDAGDYAEVAIPQPEKGTLILTVNLNSLLQQGDESQNAQLTDGSVVTIAARSANPIEVRTVSIEGAVNHPGPFALASRADRITDIVRRSGGTTPEAYPAGARIVRSRALLTSESQTAQIEAVSGLLDKVNQDTYRRYIGRAIAEEHRQEARSAKPANTSLLPTATSGGAAGAASLLPSLLAANGGSNTGVTNPTSLTPATLNDLATLATLLVTQPESMKEVQQSDVVGLDMVAALRKPGSTDDLLLEDGDRIVIPPTPTTVNVYGAVFQPGAQAYKKGVNVGDWIRNSGGFRPDGNKQTVLLVHLNGRMEAVNMKSRVEPGDTVVVPNQVQSITPEAAAKKNNSTQDAVITAAISIGLIHLILGL